MSLDPFPSTAPSFFGFIDLLFCNCMILAVEEVGEKGLVKEVEEKRVVKELEEKGVVKEELAQVW